MPTVTKPYQDFVNNIDVVDATKINAQANTLYTAVNGGLDGANVPSLGDMTTVPTTAKKAADAIAEIWNYPFASVMRQALINPGFSVNQRGVSGTVTLAAGAYGHDRWKAGAGGCTYTFVTANNVTTITITAGSLVQVIEGNNLYNGTYTLSWNGTAQGKIGAGAFGATGVTGTASGGTNIAIEFNVGTLNNVQFNFGSIKLPFQPRSVAEELSLCQRYYEKSYNVADTPGTITSAGSILFQTRTAINASTAGTLYCGKIQFKVKKRAVPAVSLFSLNGTINSVRVQNATNRTGAVPTAVGEDGFTTISIDASSATPIALDNVIDFQYTADCEL